MEESKLILDKYSKDEMIARMYIRNPDHGTHTYHFSADKFPNAENEINMYMSMNPMRFILKDIKRDKDHVARLRWLYTDLDTYNTKYTKEQILMQLEAEYFNKTIPTPTYAVDSGRGLYLLWSIDEHIKAAPRWERVQKYIFEQLEEFGADATSVTDTARVLRVPGSINSKSGTKVTILKEYSQYKYTLYEIQKEFLPAHIFELPKIYKTKNEAQICQNKGVKNNNNIIPLKTTNTMLINRIRDLETLIKKYRDKESGKRQNILFLYRYWTLCLTENKEIALENTLRLNSQLHNALSDKEVINATKSAEKYFDNNQSYKVTNTYLIKFLSLSDYEMKELKTIISTYEKIQRKRQRSKMTYLKKLELQGKDTKEAQKKSRYKAILGLLNMKKTQKEICEELKISKATYYRDKNYIDSLCQEDRQALINFNEENKVIEISTQRVVFEKKSQKFCPCIRERERERENVVLSTFDACDDPGGCSCVLNSS